MPDVYATQADVYTYAGLSHGELANPARLCASALATTDTVTLDGHGFVTGTAILFRAEAGGALPAPIVEGTTYYAIRLSDSTFQVAAAAGGAAIDLTTDGTSVVVVKPLPFDENLERYSRWVDGCLPAHIVPLVAPYPVEVTAVVAELTAQKLLRIANQSSESMKEIELGAKAQLERWAKGIPLRDARATASANLAVVGSIVSDPRGWGNGGVLP